jgi:two-component system sensor histidine kinase UhpB
MIFIKEASLPTIIGSMNEELFTAQMSEAPYYSKEMYDRGVPKRELYKMVTLIQEDERVKIGRELHDGVNPLLALAKLYLEFVIAKTEKEKFAKEQICEVILSAIDNIRSISSQLVISQRINYSLVKLITELIKKINGIDLFKINFKHSSEREVSKLGDQAKLVLYRIVQEQLNNIIRHSKARCVEIRLICKTGTANLLIEDDGVGFDSTKITDGTGLINIAARVNQFNGNMEITSSPGKGCLLNISLPIL